MQLCTPSDLCGRLQLKRPLPQRPAPLLRRNPKRRTTKKAKSLVVARVARAARAGKRRRVVVAQQVMPASVSTVF